MTSAALRVEADGFARALGRVAGDDVPPGTAPLTLEDVVQSPVPGCTGPTSFSFSPDDSLLTCLWSPEGTQTRQLMAFDAATLRCTPLAAHASEVKLTHEELLRRERARERGLGVTRYAWAKNSLRLLLPAPVLSVVDGRGAPLRAVALASTSQSPMLDAVLSPDGVRVAFVQDGELSVADAVPGREHAPVVQLTFGAGGDVTHGLACYIAQEELHRDEGFFWSHDSSALAFCRVNNSPVKRYRISHLGSADCCAEEVHAYPFAGTPNATVTLGIVRVTAPGAVTWLDVTCAGAMCATAEEEYLCRVAWSLDDSQVLVTLLDRAQKALKVVAFDTRTGARLRTLHGETSAAWINLSRVLRPLSNGQLLVSSEHSGFAHLYVAAADGTLTALTAGQWAADDLEGVDETAGVVYFTAGAESPLERHLYVTSLDGSTAEQPRRLTEEPGMHAVTLDHAMRRFVDVYDAPDQPPSATLRSLADGALIASIFKPQTPSLRAARLGLQPPQMVRFTAADGRTELHGALYLPSDDGSNTPHPLVVSIYGGPHVQLVTRSWALTVDMRAQLLRSRGFAVLKVDSRGSSRRGCAFEHALFRNMGAPELADQIAAVNQLAAQGIADVSRVGIYGWSYGGYLAALGALKAPHVFKAAVAGAPVTSWDGYDTGYTERYMGLPFVELSAYEAASALETSAWAAQTSPLLLIHGMLDENVHARHTMRLCQALTSRRAPHDLMLFPEERHLPRDLAGLAYTEERVLAFLSKHI